jgi:hypothetical protein
MSSKTSRASCVHPTERLVVIEQRDRLAHPDRHVARFDQRNQPLDDRGQLHQAFSVLT